MTDVRLYLLTGYATTPTFMEQFRLSLQRRLEGGGHNVRSELLMPYGDRSRSRMAQLQEIGRDMRLPFGRYDRAIGAARALAHIARKDDGARIVLVGHSGGGIAALQVAAMLVEREGGPPPVVLIGSPRCRIPLRMRDAVLYVYGVKPSRRTPRFAATRGGVDEHRDEKSRTGADVASVWIPPESNDELADPVCRLGSFGGWTLNHRLLPVWRMNKHAPAEARSVPIVGGHADYFRMGAPYVDSEGTTNGERSLAIVSEWLLRRL